MSEKKEDQRDKTVEEETAVPLPDPTSQESGTDKLLPPPGFKT